MKERYRKRRSEALYLLGGECCKCGEDKENLLTFDHIDPESKSFTIARGSSLSKKRWDEEIQKCQILCLTCHKIKNKTDNGEAHHGGLTMYRHYNCRCTLCVQYHNYRVRKWKRENRNK